jgi:shikimate kinase
MTLKLKRTPGLYLVGFMATGKTTVGRALADEIGWPFVDIDSEIELLEGKAISKIFSEQGEPAFREIESSVIRTHVKSIETGQPSVMALGGGAFVQPRNWDLLQNNGVTVWLDCPLDTVCKRLGDCDPTRPLAANRTRLAKLFDDRRPLYARADYRVDADTEDTVEILKRILSLPLF